MNHLRLLFIFLNIIISSSWLTSAQPRDMKFVHCLVERDHGIPFYTMNDTAYVPVLNSTYRNLRLDIQRPQVIVTPLNINQIQNVVNCARTIEIPYIRIRSGGHDMEGLSYHSTDPAFAILDLQKLRNITVDVKNKFAWVESGATVGELYYITANKSNNSLGFSTSVVHSVGIGGDFSGAGYGMMMRKYGLSADHIIDAVIIDAEGRILDRESMGEDLFWAIRGGGGNTFGVVVSWKVNLLPVPNPVTVFSVSRSREQNAAMLVHRWSNIANKMPQDIMLRVFLSRSTNSTTQAAFSALFLGTKEDLFQLIQDSFPELGARKEDCVEMSWIQSVLFFDSLDTSQPDALLDRSTGDALAAKTKSDYVKNPIPESAVKGILDMIDELEADRAQLTFTPYGGIMDDISEQSIPFPHRAGYICEIEYAVFWPPFNTSGKNSNEVSERYVNWVTKLHDYMTPYVSQSPRESLLNHRDTDIGSSGLENPTVEQARIWGVKYFLKKNFERLVVVKTAVDPSNLFRNEQSIPPNPTTIEGTFRDEARTWF